MNTTQKESYALAMGEEWADGLDALPHHMHGGVVRYVLHGIEGGRFLSSVIKGDLFGAVRAADDMNIDALPAYVNFFHNYAPSRCFGSADVHNAWVALGGVAGLHAAHTKAMADLEEDE
jgi:hypothetical protein